MLPYIPTSVEGFHFLLTCENLPQAFFASVSTLGVKGVLKIIFTFYFRSKMSNAIGDNEFNADLKRRNR